MRASVAAADLVLLVVGVLLASSCCVLHTQTHTYVHAHTVTSTLHTHTQRHTGVDGGHDPEQKFLIGPKDGRVVPPSDRVSKAEFNVLMNTLEAAASSGCCRLCPNLFYHLKPTPWLGMKRGMVQDSGVSEAEKLDQNTPEQDRVLETDAPPVDEAVGNPELASNADAPAFMQEVARLYGTTGLHGNDQDSCCNVCKEPYRNDPRYPYMLYYEGGVPFDPTLKNNYGLPAKLSKVAQRIKRERMGKISAAATAKAGAAASKLKKELSAAQKEMSETKKGIETAKAAQEVQDAVDNLQGAALDAEDNGEDDTDAVKAVAKASTSAAFIESGSQAQFFDFIKNFFKQRAKDKEAKAKAAAKQSATERALSNPRSLEEVERALKNLAMPKCCKLCLGGCKPKYKPEGKDAAGNGDGAAAAAMIEMFSERDETHMANHLRAIAVAHANSMATLQDAEQQHLATHAASSLRAGSFLHQRQQHMSAAHGAIPALPSDSLSDDDDGDDDGDDSDAPPLDARYGTNKGGFAFRQRMGFLGGLIDSAKKAGKSLVNKAKSSGKSLFNQAKSAGKSFFNKAKSTGKNLLNKGKNLFNQAKSAGKNLLNQGKNAFNNLKNSKNLGALVNNAKNAGKNLWNQAKTAGKGLLNKGKNLWNQAKTQGKALLNQGKAALGNIAQKAKGHVNNFLNSAKAAGKNLWDQAKAHGKNLLNKGKDLWNKAKQGGQSIIDRGKAFIANAKKAAQDLWKKGQAAVAAARQKALNLFKQAVDPNPGATAAAAAAMSHPAKSAALSAQGLAALIKDVKPIKIPSQPAKVFADPSDAPTAFDPPGAEPNAPDRCEANNNGCCKMCYHTWTGEMEEQHRTNYEREAEHRRKLRHELEQAGVDILKLASSENSVGDVGANADEQLPQAGSSAGTPGAAFEAGSTQTEADVSFGAGADGTVSTGATTEATSLQ
jgi:hypothetical protein